MFDMGKKTYRMAFRCTKEEAAFLKKMAGVEGRPVGNLIRAWLMLHKLETMALTAEEISAMKKKIEDDALAEITKRKRTRAKKAA